MATCKKCGCTDNNCSQCIEKTGEACYWVDDNHDLCSACAEDYFFKCLSGYPMIIFIGRNIEIQPLNFIKLEVGSKISEIGTNKKGMAVLNRCDTFSPYITYVGLRFESMNKMQPNHKSKLLMFKVRDEDKPESVSKTDDMYIAYKVLFDSEYFKYELQSVDPENGIFNIYQPEFKLFEG